MLNLPLLAALLSATKQVFQLLSTPVSTPLPLDVVATFGGASDCEQIFQTKRYECGVPCSGPANNTILGTAVSIGKYNARGLVSYSNPLNTIFVTFRPTRGIADAAQFLKQDLSEADWNIPGQNSQSTFGVPNLKVHTGYEEIYVEMRNEIQATIDRLQNAQPNAQIVFIGHSLGGALAEFAAVDYQNRKQNWDRITLYSFGQPRLGNDEWAKYVNARQFKMYRIVRMGDPIPDVPALSLGYVHSSDPYYILDTGMIIPCPPDNGTGESSLCRSNVFARNQRFHGKSNYFGIGVGC
jgi:broad specificity phosphatase PhoE